MKKGSAAFVGYDYGGCYGCQLSACIPTKDSFSVIPAAMLPDRRASSVLLQTSVWFLLMMW